MDELTKATWIKSSYSGGNGGDCVEVASLTDGRRGVRDSKNPAGPAFMVDAVAWTAFCAVVKDGSLI
ncbi:DUF397 domain-containing protein [Sphaerisporangium rubeum]|uniref:DUF397 domain-containing protein n=1 Tax=Sphaerisporangium rubeum TaxID=321317 RepID=A0A7X0IHV4_9ACTN|nr:DUF397 domain-containing protein [Sphaerisporangium rubeum]MBB6475529.1 hypothetical protein [Sphaerisporangium rubeum]